MPNVWGAQPAIDMTRVTGPAAEAFAAIERHPNVVDADELAALALPELEAAWISAIDQGWLENVGAN